MGIFNQEKMKKYNIHFLPSDMKKLQELAKSKGMKTNTFIRMIVKDSIREGYR